MFLRADTPQIFSPTRFALDLSKIFKVQGIIFSLVNMCVSNTSVKSHYENKRRSKSISCAYQTYSWNSAEAPFCPLHLEHYQTRRWMTITKKILFTSTPSQYRSLPSSLLRQNKTGVWVISVSVSVSPSLSLIFLRKKYVTETRTKSQKLFWKRCVCSYASRWWGLTQWLPSSSSRNKQRRVRRTSTELRRWRNLSAHWPTWPS